MSLHEVGRYVLRYTGLAAGVTVAALFGAALWTGVLLQLPGMTLVAPALVGPGVGAILGVWLLSVLG